MPSIELIRAREPVASAESDVKASGWGGKVFMSSPVEAFLKCASISSKNALHKYYEHHCTAVPSDEAEITVSSGSQRVSHIVSVWARKHCDQSGELWKRARYSHF